MATCSRAFVCVRGSVCVCVCVFVSLSRTSQDSDVASNGPPHSARPSLLVVNSHLVDAATLPACSISYLPRPLPSPRTLPTRHTVRFLLEPSRHCRYHQRVERRRLPLAACVFALTIGHAAVARSALLPRHLRVSVTFSSLLQRIPLSLFASHAFASVSPLCPPPPTLRCLVLSLCGAAPPPLLQPWPARAHPSPAGAGRVCEPLLLRAPSPHFPPPLAPSPPCRVVNSRIFSPTPSPPHPSRLPPTTS